MSEIKEDVKKYQWKKVDDFGKIVEVKNVSGKFTKFTDGSRIFTEILPEFLTEIINGELPFPGADAAIVGFQGVNAVEPSDVNEITKTKENKVQEIAPIELNPVSSLQVLIKTLSKKNVEGVDVKFNVNIPKKKVIEMLIENSEENKSELVNAVILNAIEEIEINKLQEFLQSEITNFINKYYE